MGNKTPDTLSMKQIMCTTYRSPMIILMMILLLTTAYSQTDTISNSSPLMWVTLGSGAGGDRTMDGLSGYLSASYFSHTRLFSIRFLFVGKSFTMEPLTDHHENEIDESYEISGLYGTGIRSSLFFASASAGLGVVRLRKHNDAVQILPGIPLEAQAFITPLPVLGIGVTLFGNINGKSTYMGGLLCIRIGKLWPTK
jgi:hypothetical protein